MINRKFMELRCESLADMSLLAPGDLLFFSGTYFSSRVIRWWTKSDISHVGFYYLQNGKIPAVLEATNRRGVSTYPLCRYLNTRPNLRVYAGKLAASEYNIDREQLLDIAFLEWGKTYAGPLQFIRSFGTIARPVADFLALPEDTDGNRFFCSEYMTHVLNLSGFASILQQSKSPTARKLSVPASVTPDDLFKQNLLSSQLFEIVRGESNEEENRSG